MGSSHCSLACHRICRNILQEMIIGLSSPNGSKTEATVESILCLVAVCISVVEVMWLFTWK
jgi:hypothetical protein